MALSEKRRVSVVRFYGKKEPGGPDNSDSWVDVAILDSITIESGRGHQYQKITYTFEYADNENPVRKQTELKVKNPLDDTQYVTIPLVKRIKMKSGRQNQFQDRYVKFENVKENTVRKIHKKKVYHNNIADRYLDDDKKPPKDPQKYLDAVNGTAEQDKEQKLEVEVIDVIKFEINSRATWQDKNLHLNWKGDILMKEPLVPGPSES
jgi:hypothetical protein